MVLGFYRPFDPSNKTMWHLAADKTLKTLAGQVLNHPRVVTETYRKMNLPAVLGLLGRCARNALVIGQKHSWIVNAKTCHSLHYVGSQMVVGLTFAATN